MLAGDYRAVMVFLQISARRARLNSLDSPAALDKLNATAQRHLDDEEQNIVPLAAVTLTQQEWDAMGKHGLAQMPSNKRRLAFAMIPRAARRGRPCLHEAVPGGPGADALPALDRLALEEVHVHAARRNLTLHTTEVEVRSDPGLQISLSWWPMLETTDQLFGRGPNGALLAPSGSTGNRPCHCGLSRW